jgi:hypothetical protein
VHCVRLGRFVNWLNGRRLLISVAGRWLLSTQRFLQGHWKFGCVLLLRAIIWIPGRSWKSSSDLFLVCSFCNSNFQRYWNCIGDLQFIVGQPFDRFWVLVELRSIFAESGAACQTNNQSHSRSRYWILSRILEPVRDSPAQIVLSGDGDLSDLFRSHVWYFNTWIKNAGNNYSNSRAECSRAASPYSNARAVFKASWRACKFKCDDL